MRKRHGLRVDFLEIAMPQQPPANLEDLPEWIREYLAPSVEGRGHIAFQFTINGVTYPFVRNMHFAAVPEPPAKRRYSMLAMLYMTRPGDLVFFFQSDPQWNNLDIDSRRGLRGVYRVVSEPFRADSDIIDPNTSYKILAKCPACGSPFSTLAKACKNEQCARLYPTMVLPSGDPYHFLHLGLRLELEPLVVFERAISDERAYADMTDTGMLWVGRHDNQMGAGKGSSVRQLIPEEAVKLTRMMISEPGQVTNRPARVRYQFPKSDVKNEDGTPATHLEVRGVRTPRVVFEHMINFDVARQFDVSGSSLARALGTEYDISRIEYASSEFPWGYTAGEADFVISLSRNGRRSRIYIMEFKADRINDAAVIQVSLYARWVCQVMCQFAKPRVDSIEIVPVVIGRRLDPGTTRPHQFNFSASYNSGARVDARVESPLYIEYEPQGIYTANDKKYATSLRYQNLSSRLPQISWEPAPGVVTSQVERDWVETTSWTTAKRSGGH